MEVPLFQGIFTPTTLILWHILGAYFLLLWGVGVVRNIFRKGHKLFQHKIFGPHPKHPILGPEKKFTCLVSWDKSAKEAHKHKLFREILGVKSGVPNGPFSATKSLVYCFLFLPLILQFGALEAKTREMRIVSLSFLRSHPGKPNQRKASS